MKLSHFILTEGVGSSKFGKDKDHALAVIFANDPAL
jgi:hypothetical protein